MKTSSPPGQKKHVVFLSLGTNLGDRIANLRSAVHALESAMTVRQESKIYETPPWGFEDQGAFLNMVVRTDTDVEPEALLELIKKIEVDLGRERSFHWGPRLIDIDILFYDDLVLNAPSIILPHPHIQERAFVLVPLADIAPDFIHPVLKMPIRKLLSAVDRSGIKPL